MSYNSGEANIVRRLLETSMVDMDGETMYGRRTITRSTRPCTAKIGIERG